MLQLSDRAKEEDGGKAGAGRLGKSKSKKGAKKGKGKKGPYTEADLQNALLAIFKVLRRSRLRLRSRVAACCDGVFASDRSDSWT